MFIRGRVTTLPSCGPSPPRYAMMGVPAAGPVVFQAKLKEEDNLGFFLE
jgi:hypothetical protein